MNLVLVISMHLKNQFNTLNPKVPYLDDSVLYNDCRPHVAIQLLKLISRVDWRRMDDTTSNQELSSRRELLGSTVCEFNSFNIIEM